jgi:ArsR family transcriptional regulator
MNNFLFKALGEETKFLILKLLLDGELCACNIPKQIKRTQSNTSMHLSKLLEWDLIQSRRDGKMILYSIKDKRVNKAFMLVKCQKSKISEHDKKPQFFTGDLK